MGFVCFLKPALILGWIIILSEWDTSREHPLTGITQFYIAWCCRAGCFFLTGPGQAGLSAFDRQTTEGGRVYVEKSGKYSYLNVFISDSMTGFSSTIVHWHLPLWCCWKRHEVTQGLLGHTAWREDLLPSQTGPHGACSICGTQPNQEHNIVPLITTAKAMSYSYSNVTVIKDKMQDWQIPFMQFPQ